MDYPDSAVDIMSFLELLQDPDPTQRNAFVDTLPKIREAELIAQGHKDDHCPICQETFLSVLASEEMAEAMDSPAVSIYDLGVTKIPACGHLFCRKEGNTSAHPINTSSISKWIISAKKDSCPACRTLIGLRPSPPQSSTSTSPNPNARQSPFSPQLVEESMRNLSSFFPEATDLPAALGVGVDSPEMQQRFREALAQFGVSFANSDDPLSSFNPGNGGSSASRHDDRSEYSSMYS